MIRSFWPGDARSSTKKCRFRIPGHTRFDPDEVQVTLDPRIWSPITCPMA
jgi:hypothetical protein